MLVIIYIIFLLEIFLFKHYKINIGKIYKNLRINPYFYVKNDNKLNIIFWDYHFGSKLNEFIIIYCNDSIKSIKRNNNSFILDSQNIPNSNINTFNFISFDKVNLYYNFDNMSTIKLEYTCKLKDLEIFFKFPNTNGKTFISNLQIYDTDILDINLNFWTPLIFTNLRTENINTNKFKNKFNLFHGGYNGSLDIKYSQLNSFYDQDSGVNWMIIQDNQFIKLDNKVFSVINNQINKSFTVYINYNIINKFLDFSNINNLKRNYIYQVKNGSNSTLSIQIWNYSKNNNINISFKQIKPNLFIYTKIILLEDNNHVFKQINKNNIGVKFLIFTYFNSSKYKYILGFKKDSNFIDNNKFIIEKNYTNTLDLDINDINYKYYNHFIGNQQNHTVLFDGNSKVLFYIQINEYAIFNGSDFDEIEKNDSDIYFKINGPIKIIINNNYNLERRFNLYSKIKLFKCSTFKCNICNNNDICLFCYYNYFLNEKNECILNTEINKFVNEYSDIIEYNSIINNHNFIFTNDLKNISYLKEFLIPNVIIFLNIGIVTNNIHNLWNIELNNPLKLNYNIYFENNIKNKAISWYLNQNNFDFNKYTFQIKDNLAFKLQLKIQKHIIDCNNLENELIYKDINCNNLCSQNYYYSSFNYKKGYCLKKIITGYYADSGNLILKCPWNCKNCVFDNVKKIINCTQCINGYKIIDNSCFIKNEFNCEQNNDLNYNFDNNNEDNIKICEEFCNLCRNKKAYICAINNFNYDYCDINNIKILVPNKELLNENLMKCEIYKDNKCFKCKNEYYLNKINLCDNCLENCIKCKSSSKCLECTNNSYLEHGECKLCNFKFDNCLKCTNNSCTHFNEIKIIQKQILCNIKGCSLCEINNLCKICHKNFILINNQCLCNFGSNYYLYNNKCNNCKYCNKCVSNKINKCTVCPLCKIPIKFRLFQNKNYIFILFNKYIKLIKNDNLIKIQNIKNYNIKFQINQIELTIFDEKFKNTKIFINKNIIKDSIQGKAINQIFNIKSFNIQDKNLKKQNQKLRFSFIKYYLKNGIIENAIKLSSNTLDYSRFILFLLPLIILNNKTSLFILLNTTINEDFKYLLQLTKKNNKPFISNEVLIPYHEFKTTYKKIKKKYKNNEIIGNINLIDLNFILITIIFGMYFIVKYAIKKLPINSITLFIKKYLIYLKWIPFILFQSYLINYYYKIIFFTEILFNLNCNYLKIYLSFWIQFNLIIILCFLNYNYYFCSLFIDIQNFKNYKDYEFIKLFVSYKRKETRNYNLISNMIDFFIVITFTLINYFEFQFLLLLLISLAKLLYCIQSYFIYKKFRLFAQIISIIWIINFYILTFFNHILIKINSISNILIIYFILINIWEIIIIIINKSFKLIKYLNEFFNKTGTKNKSF